VGQFDVFGLVTTGSNAQTDPLPENGINTAIIVWENKAHAEAFNAVGEGWQQALEQMGHTLQSDNRGETVIELEPHT